MKIRPVEAELFHADVQTDMSKLIVAFRKFANAPKKGRLVVRSSAWYLVPSTRYTGLHAKYPLFLSDFNES